MAKDKKQPPEADIRRRYRRYPHKTALWFEINEDESLHRVHTVDVSAGGVLVVIDQPLPIGGCFKIHLELPMFLDLISATCTVRSCTQKDDLYQVGIEFGKVIGVTKEQLVKFLKAYFGD